MPNSLVSNSDPNRSPLVLEQNSVERCHVILPDFPKPVGAIIYRKQFYSYVKFFSTMDAALRAADRLLDRGNPVILTKAPKGFVLWVLEPEAQLVTKHAL